MKKNVWGVIAALALGCLLSGCQNAISVPTENSPAAAAGSLTVTITEKVSRTIIPTISMTPASYDISGTGPESATFSKTITAGSSTTIEGLAIGAWTVTVVAKNDSGTTIGSGTETVSVVSNASVSVGVTVLPYSGFGTLDLSVDWTPSEVQIPNVDGKLVPATGTARDIAFTVDGAAGTANFTATDVAAGFYTLTLKLCDNGYTTMGAVEVVRIVKDQTSSGNFSFSDINKATGKIDVNITADMGDPLAVAISGAAASKPANQALSLTAAVADYSGNVTYVWYVNGEAVETGCAYSFGTDWAQGFYRVDVTAYSANGKRAGSASTQIAVTAPSGTQASWFTYEVSGDSVAITGLSDEWTASTATDKNDLVIPSTLEGKSVTAIADNAFFSKDTLNSVVIPNSVTSINRSAFAFCTGLTSITLPQNLSAISEASFSHCIGFNTINIPASVRSIGNYAFQTCNAMTTITIPDACVSIGNSAFANCFSLESVSLPASLASIGNSAFDNCQALASIAIPSSVTTIESSAFSRCRLLASVSFSATSSLDSIGASAFFQCSNLTHIDLPSSLTSLGASAFTNCKRLESATIPSGISRLEDETFYNCTQLTSISIPATVQSFGESVFWGCTHLTSIFIPEGVTAIPQMLCMGCCFEMTSLTIPSTVTSIGRGAFWNCMSLKQIVVNATTPPSLEKNAIYPRVSGMTIAVPAGSVDAYRTNQYWSEYASLIVSQ